MATMEHIDEFQFGKDRRYMRGAGNILVRKRRTRKGILKITFCIAVLIFLIAAAGFGLKEGYLYLISSSEYDVRSIRITGCERTNPDDLKSSISSILRRNIFTIDLDALKKQLKEKNPWVENASIKKSLPSEIDIDITERKPAAFFLMNSTIYLADREAVPIGEMKPDFASFNFPVLTGIEAKTEEESIRRIKFGIGIIEQIRKCWPTMIEMISEINCSEDDYVKVILTDGSPVIYIDSETLAENINNYLSIKEEIAQRFDKVEYIDLRWKNRVIVKPLSFVR